MEGKRKIDEDNGTGSSSPKKYSRRDEQTFLKQYHSNDKIYRVILLGLQGAGQASLINSLNFRPTDTIRLCKQCVSPSQAIRYCREFKLELFGQKLAIVNTPGFTNPNIDENDLFDELLNGLNQIAPGPDAGVDVFILIMRPEFIGKDHKMMFNMIEKRFGAAIYDHMIVVFTCQDYLEAEGSSLSQFLDSIQDSILKRILGRVNFRCLSVNNRAPNVQQAERIVEKIVHFASTKHGTYRR